jgi:hypothetical protein
MIVRRVIPPVLVAVAFAGAWYALHSRELVEVNSPPSQTAPATTASPGTPLQEKASPIVETAATPVAASVEQMIADANGADAARRAAAISALARAPRAQAVPVLQQLLRSGPSEDRPLALKSLQQLALEQGDADGAVRAAIREVIYHGNDETLMAAAQDTLDVVEESELR